MNPGLGGHDVPLEGKSGFIIGAPEGFLGGSDGKASACQFRRPQGSTPGSGRSPGEGNSYPLQYSCLENSMAREAWRATVHRVTKHWI